MAKNNCTTVDHLTMLGLRCLTSSNAKFLELTETVTAALEEVDNTKQDKLTFDTTPTSGSTKPVTSGGVYTALSGKAATSHASTATTYGIGNGSKYGHVKLSDSTSSTSGASAGIAASPAAVKAAYDLASEAKTLAQGSTSVTALTAAQIKAICT